MTAKRFQYNVNKNSIEYNKKHFAYCNVEQNKIANKLNELHEENKQLLCTIVEILDFIEDKREVSIEEMRRWWKEKEKELIGNDCKNR